VSDTGPARQALIERLTAQATLLRRHVVRSIYQCGKGHYGGALSPAEIVAALYFHALRLDPTRPAWPDRDRFVLSKGHGAAILYAALAERGYFPPRWLATYKQPGSRLQGHPDMTKTPGVDMTSGALGEGLSVGLGMALAGRLDGRDYRVYVLLGDGEMQEGSVWEAAMAIAHHRLDHLTAIVDVNGLQVDGPTDAVVSLGSLADKLRAFGWQAVEIDGHDVGQVLDALDLARETAGRPTAIVARTVKGRGVSFMEGVTEWHSNVLSPAQLAQALAELAEADCDREA
jgi:transketolase